MAARYAAGKLLENLIHKYRILQSRENFFGNVHVLLNDQYSGSPVSHDSLTWTFLCVIQYSSDLFSDILYCWSSVWFIHPVAGVYP